MIYIVLTGIVVILCVGIIKLINYISDKKKVDYVINKINLSKDSKSRNNLKTIINILNNREVSENGRN